MVGWGGGGRVARPEDGNVFWETSLGKGRPGWHIECSAMSIAELGETIDIHTGGIDNMFPHHENEIAQSECATGHTFVKYWMHNAWLLVDGKKMSKSAGNFYTLRDIIEKGYDPISFRYLSILNHYTTPLNFTFEALEAAQTALNRLKKLYSALGENIGSVNQGYKNAFKAHIGFDLGIPQGASIIWHILEDQNVLNADKKATLLDFDRVLGLGLSDIKQEIIPEEVLNLVQDREEARKNKDFAKSDKLRDAILKMGYEVKDTPGGPKVNKI